MSSTEDIAGRRARSARGFDGELHGHRELILHLEEQELRRLISKAAEGKRDFEEHRGRSSSNPGEGHGASPGPDRELEARFARQPGRTRGWSEGLERSAGGDWPLVERQELRELAVPQRIARGHRE